MVNLNFKVSFIFRVLDLEKKKEEITAVVDTKQKSSNNEDEDVEEEFDEFLDWRSKKSFK